MLTLAGIVAQRSAALGLCASCFIETSEKQFWGDVILTLAGIVEGGCQWVRQVVISAFGDPFLLCASCFVETCEKQCWRTSFGKALSWALEGTSPRQCRDLGSEAQRLKGPPRVIVPCVSE